MVLSTDDLRKDLRPGSAETQMDETDLENSMPNFAAIGGYSKSRLEPDCKFVDCRILILIDLISQMKEDLYDGSIFKNCPKKSWNQPIGNFNYCTLHG